MNPDIDQINWEPIIFFIEHSLLVMAVSAVVFFSLGLWFGWLTWARHKRRARAFQEECDLLRHEIASLKRRIVEESSIPIHNVTLSEPIAPEPIEEPESTAGLGGLLGLPVVPEIAAPAVPEKVIPVPPPSPSPLALIVKNAAAAEPPRVSLQKTAPVPTQVLPTPLAKPEGKPIIVSKLAPPPPAPSPPQATIPPPKPALPAAPTIAVPAATSPPLAAPVSTSPAAALARLLAIPTPTPPPQPTVPTPGIAAGDLPVAEKLASLLAQAVTPAKAASPESKTEAPAKPAAPSRVTTKVAKSPTKPSLPPVLPTQGHAVPAPPPTSAPPAVVIPTPPASPATQALEKAFAAELAKNAAILDPALGVIFHQRPERWDDLTLLRGVAEILQNRLHDHGVFTFKQIALWGEDHAREFSTLFGFKERIHREKWIQQARDLHFLKYGERV